MPCREPSLEGTTAALQVANGSWVRGTQPGMYGAGQFRSYTLAPGLGLKIWGVGGEPPAPETFTQLVACIPQGSSQKQGASLSAKKGQEPQEMSTQKEKEL